MKWLLLLLVFSVNQCSFQIPRHLRVSVKVGGQRPIVALSEMTCFFVSLTGSGIDALSHPVSSCVPIGVIRSNTVSLTELRNGVSISNVTVGSRTLVVYGVKMSSGSCPSDVQSLFNNSAANLAAYRITDPLAVEIKQNQTISLNSSYQPSSATDLVEACLLNLAIGTSESCAMKGGKMKCWGYNSTGQLGKGHLNNLGGGAGEMGDNLSTIDLGGLRTVKQIVTGYGHSCALLDNNSVKCWGENDYGELGQEHTNVLGDAPGEMGDSLPAIDLGSARTAKQIAIGGAHTCALLDNSSVKCWGYNLHGQLGQEHINPLGGGSGEMGDSLPVINLGTGRTAKQIATGYIHSCALLDNDSVKCWGWNGYGELGQGHTNALGGSSSEMGNNLQAIDLGNGRTAKQIVAGGSHSGGSHTCALLNNNSVKCWGGNEFGQLGLGHISSLGDGVGEMGENLPPLNLGSF